MSDSSPSRNGESLRWPGEHDVLCERIAVDIGVGEMQSPCGCEVRWYHERLVVAQSLLDRAKERGELPEWTGDMMSYFKQVMAHRSEIEPSAAVKAAYAEGYQRGKEDAGG